MRDMDVDEHRKKKYETKQVREDYERLNGFDTCEVVVRSFLEFGMNHINNLTVKELRVLLSCHFGSETFNGSPNKVELVGSVNELPEAV